MMWEPIAEVRAKKTQGTRTDLNFSQKFEKSWAGDTIARRVGIGSEETYRKGREVVTYMDFMLRCGSERGSILRMNLNDDSINAAYKAMKKDVQFDEEAERKRKREEEERLKRQETARQRYLEAVKKAEHCTLYHCSVADLSCYVQAAPSKPRITMSHPGFFSHDKQPFSQELFISEGSRCLLKRDVSPFSIAAFELWMVHFDECLLSRLFGLSCCYHML
jgi:hypothetical protein